MTRHGPFVLLLVLGATACRPGEHTAARQTPATDAPSPAHAQRLTTATISDPKTFNPILAVDASSGDATEPLFEGLVRLNPQTLVREPVLAERWEFSADGTVCTFFLRRDVCWHVRGSAVLLAPFYAMAIAAPVVAPCDYTEQNRSLPNCPPSSLHFSPWRLWADSLPRGHRNTFYSVPTAWGATCSPASFAAVA